MLKLDPVFNVEITCDCNMIGCWKFLAIKLMKPKELAECHQTPLFLGGVWRQDYILTWEGGGRLFYALMSGIANMQDRPPGKDTTII